MVDEAMDKLNGEDLRVYWHPYVSDERNIWVDVTGLSGRALLKAIGIAATITDAEHIAEVGRSKRPFNDPRLGCLRYSPN